MCSLVSELEFHTQKILFIFYCGKAKFCFIHFNEILYLGYETTVISLQFILKAFCKEFCL